MNHIKSNTKYFALLLLVPYLAYSENVSIITVSGQKVMTESATGKAIQEKLQREQAKLTEPLQKAQAALQANEKKLKDDQENLQKEFAKFDNDSKTMSPEAKDKKTIELENKALDFDNKRRTFERDAKKLQTDMPKAESKMSEIYQAEMMKLDTLVKTTVKEEAEKNGWDVVLMEESVMYANPKTSRTNLIIEKLDAKTKALNMAKKEAIEKKSDTNAKK